VAKVEVPAAVRGQLVEVRVKEGQSVKKGEVLARLDDAVQQQTVELARLDAAAQAEVKQAEARVAYAQTEWQQWEKNGAATDTEKRLKKLQLTQAELELEQKKEQVRQKQVVLQREQITLDRMTIRSPIDGVVLRVNKAAGEATDEGPLVVVVQTTRLGAVFYPPRQMFAKVHVGDKVKLELATDPAVQREATVVAVDPIVDPASQLFRVKMEFDNADGRVPAGTAAAWDGAAK
jgi:RND family efflux transporter MFP subunit